MSSRKTGNEAFPFDNTPYKQRHLIENTFSRLKDRRRITTRMTAMPIPFSQLSALLSPVSFILINES